MYPLRALSPVLLLSIIPIFVYSAAVVPIHTPRQDTALADFQLLGPNADCFDFSFDRNTFSATCISINGTPSSSGINLDACITNNNGNMAYQSK